MWQIAILSLATAFLKFWFKFVFSVLRLPWKIILTVLTLEIIICSDFENLVLAMADNMKTLIFHQALFPPSLSDLQSVKIQLNNSVHSAFSSLKTHIQYRPTGCTAVMYMDQGCCFWCFQTNSWLISTFFIYFFLSVMFFSPYHHYLWCELPVDISS